MLKTFEVTYKVDNVEHVVKVKNCYTELQATMKFRESYCKTKLPGKYVEIIKCKEELLSGLFGNTDDIFSNFGDIFGGGFKK